MNFLNLNIPGLTKDDNGAYAFQGFTVDRIYIEYKNYKDSHRSPFFNSLTIEFHPDTLEETTTLMKEFNFDNGKFTNFGVVFQKEINQVGCRFILDLTLWRNPNLLPGLTKDFCTIINEDGEKTLEVI